MLFLIIVIAYVQYKIPNIFDRNVDTDVCLQLSLSPDLILSLFQQC